MAAHTYTANHNEYYPLAYWYNISGQITTIYAWDFTTVKDWQNNETRIVPGLLWQGEDYQEIQQCPSFDGAHNWTDDPYTGYNYNTSYIGHGSGETIQISARTSDVIRPAECAVFGDGQYAGGANKFMRAPWPSEGDSFFGRAAGTQGFRHWGKTNVAYADGHARSSAFLYRETDESEKINIAPETGFLSRDNSAYDLR